MIGRQQSAMGTYGSRGKLAGADAGIRRVAATFGKALFLTYSEKSNGKLVVESDSERLVAHMLCLDPGVWKFAAQPFTIDLLDHRVLRTPDAVAEARRKHRLRTGRKFYTPDFAVEWHSGHRSAIEVKLDGFHGDADYDATLEASAQILNASGYQFSKVIVPAKPKSPLRSNLPLLKQASSRIDLWPTSELVKRIEAVSGEGCIKLSSLCAQLDLSPNLVPALLVSGAVAASVALHAINGEMELQPAFGDLSHLELLQGICQ